VDGNCRGHGARELPQGEGWVSRKRACSKVGAKRRADMTDDRVRDLARDMGELRRDIAAGASGDKLLDRVPRGRNSSSLNFRARAEEARRTGSRARALPNERNKTLREIAAGRASRADLPAALVKSYDNEADFVGDTVRDGMKAIPPLDPSESTALARRIWRDTHPTTPIAAAPPHQEHRARPVVGRHPLLRL